ncbi:MAG: hypothetical protein WDM92_08995 [Caulobacteraceae bacterium]
MDPTEREALGRQIAELIRILKDAERQAAVATSALGAPAAQAIGDLKRAEAYLAVTPAPRGADLSSLVDPAWADVRSVADLILAGRSLSAATAAIAGRFNETGVRADYAAIRSGCRHQRTKSLPLPRPTLSRQHGAAPVLCRR